MLRDVKQPSGQSDGPSTASNSRTDEEMGLPEEEYDPDTEQGIVHILARLQALEERRSRL